jgi:FAD/FMN-containing dehydrogenase
MSTFVRRDQLSDYAGLRTARADIAHPETTDDVRALLRRARREGRRVTVRGAGGSLDDRALGDDLVISTLRLASIAIDERRCVLHVGPGATWGEILRRLPAGLVPKIVVTGSHLTAGGTLTSNSVSRFSSAFGREADHVLAFDLVTADGRLLHCTRDNEHRRVFAALTGGFGYLGVITRITYALLDLRHLAQDGRGLVVRTTAERVASFEELGAALLPSSDTSEPEGIFSFALLDGRGVVHRSRYAPAARLSPLPISRRPSFFRAALEIAVWWPPLARVLWAFIQAVYYRARTTFVDELFGFTFCMDTNARATALFREKLGELHLTQETWIIPAALHERAAAVDRLARFLRRLSTELDTRGFRPTLFDVLWVRGEGYAVTVAFVGRDRAKVSALAACLAGLSRDCLALGGHVHLVKNVHADPDVLAAMHGDRFAELLALKRRLDPTGVFANAFLDRVLRPASRRGDPPPSRRAIRPAPALTSPLAYL